MENNSKNKHSVADAMVIVTTIFVCMCVCLLKGYVSQRLPTLALKSLPSLVKGHHGVQPTDHSYRIT